MFNLERYLYINEKIQVCNFFNNMTIKFLCNPKIVILFSNVHSMVIFKNIKLHM